MDFLTDHWSLVALATIFALALAWIFYGLRSPVSGTDNGTPEIAGESAVPRASVQMDSGPG
jgi:hypothetical protein